MDEIRKILISAISDLSNKELKRWVLDNEDLLETIENHNIDVECYYFSIFGRPQRPYFF